MGRKKGISDAKLALYNRLQREKFKAVPATNRMLFLPHCLRKPQGCRADNTADGLVCKHCSPDCSVNMLSSYASKKGYKCFIVPGGEMLFNIVEREKPGAILGVACHHEMAQAAERLGGEDSTVSFAYQGVPLSKSGCVDTRVDLEAVKNVLDLEGPPPCAAPAAAAASVFSPARRRALARYGGIAASVTVALAAMLLVLPGLLAPPASVPGSPEPALAFSTAPTAYFSKDQNGNAKAEIKVPVFNRGPGEAEGVMVRATAYYCGRMYEPERGGLQIVAVNGTIAPGARYDVTLQVRVHGLNDTSITIETLRHNKVEVLGQIKTPKPVFLRNAGVTSVETTLAGKTANVTVQVYNDGGVWSSGTLKVVTTSYTSYGTRADSAETPLDRMLPQGDTWSFTVQLKISSLDAGHPNFGVELFKGQDSSPADSYYFEA